MQVAVAGGTGWIGRVVVARLRDSGHDVAVLTRSAGVDLTTGAGLETALRGAAAVIDVSNVATTSRATSVGFFDAVSRHLVAGCRQTGVRHLVALSIVGVDRVDLGYYAGKRRQEEVVLSGAVPASVLRATQFHEFAAQMLRRRGPLVPVPVLLSRPVAAREVAAALVDLAVGPAAGLAPELAGPRRERMPDMVRRLLRRRGGHRLVLPVRVPGTAGRGMADGGLLPVEDGPRGVETFDEWLLRTEGPAVPPGSRS